MSLAGLEYSNTKGQLARTNTDRETRPRHVRGDMARPSPIARDGMIISDVEMEMEMHPTVLQVFLQSCLRICTDGYLLLSLRGSTVLLLLRITSCRRDCRFPRLPLVASGDLGGRLQVIPDKKIPYQPSGANHLPSTHSTCPPGQAKP